MTECRPLTELPPDSVIVTAEQIKFLVVSTYSRVVGTNVTVQCQPGLVLNGPTTVRCMQSGHWSADPYCSYPSEGTTSSPTSGMDDAMVLVTVLSVVGFLIATLIVFVCVSMYWEKIRSKKIKQYRESSDYYLEDVSSQPFRKHPDNKIYERNITPVPPERPRYHQEPKLRESEELHHIEDDNYDDRQYGHNLERRHVRQKCPHCVHRYDVLRRVHSANDILYENQPDVDDGDKLIRDRRRDGYLWRSRASFSELNIPRPYYEMPGMPHYIAYYGPGVTANV